MSVSSPKIFTVRKIKAQHSHMWSERRIEDEVDACTDRNLLKIFLKYLPKNGLILEAGCGLGAWLITLLKMGYKIEGIDFDKNVIKRLKKFDSKLKISVQNVERTLYKPNSLDACISLGVIEHFEEGPELALAETFRILKPKGLMILTVPYNNVLRKIIYHPLRSAFTKYLKFKNHEVYFAEYRFNKNEIINQVKKAGFKIVAIDFDDYCIKTESLGLWADWPFLRSSKPYKLNLPGRLVASAINLLPWVATSGICIIAKK